MAASMLREVKATGSGVGEVGTDTAAGGGTGGVSAVSRLPGRAITAARARAHRAAAHGSQCRFREPPRAAENAAAL